MKLSQYMKSIAILLLIGFMSAMICGLIPANAGTVHASNHATTDAMEEHVTMYYEFSTVMISNGTAVLIALISIIALIYLLPASSVAAQLSSLTAFVNRLIQATRIRISRPPDVTQWLAQFELSPSFA